MNQSFLTRFGERLIRLLYPRVCPVCGEILPTVTSVNLQQNPFLCKSCRRFLTFPQEPRCLCCSRPLLEDTEAYCTDCRCSRKYFDQGTALLLHDETAKKILYDLKYSNKRDHADMLALEAVRRLGERIRRWNPDVMMPVPLHPKRELQRGFNQSEVLADRLSRYLQERKIDLPVDCTWLHRIKKTLPQKELSGYQRKENIDGAFAVAAGGERKKRIGGPEKERGVSAVLPAEYRRILLVDDIYTSGATLSECARVLKAAGAERVFFLTFSIG